MWIQSAEGGGQKTGWTEVVIVMSGIFLPFWMKICQLNRWIWLGGLQPVVNSHMPFWIPVHCDENNTAKAGHKGAYLNKIWKLLEVEVKTLHIANLIKFINWIICMLIPFGCLQLIVHPHFAFANKIKRKIT